MYILSCSMDFQLLSSIDDVSQDPNARNCHGYRKFVKRSILEDPSRGFLVDDAVIIKYSIDLVVTQGNFLDGQLVMSLSLFTHIIFVCV